MCGAEPGQKDCCDVVAPDSRQHCGRDGRAGECVVESGVGTQRHIPTSAVAVHGGRETDQQDAERDAESARQVVEASAKGATMSSGAAATSRAAWTLIGIALKRLIAKTRVRTYVRFVCEGDHSRSCDRIAAPGAAANVRFVA